MSEDLEELESENHSDERDSTGITGLNDVLGGGLPRGHLFLVEGEPGTGKTTMGLQFLLAGVRAGEKGMYITLSESKRELLGVARSHHWSIKDIALFEYTPTEQNLREEDQYSAFHPSEVEFQDITKSFLEQIEAIQPRRIVFDSLSELRLLARDSLRYRRQILALKHYFSNRNCTVLFLDDRTSESQNQLQNIAHGVIVMERISRVYGAERRRIRVSKLRGSRFREGFHDYTIETGGIQVYPRLIAAEHVAPAKQGAARSGIDQLDALTGGGLPYGSSTLVIGPAGVGKSSVSMNYAVEAARGGENAVFYTFDETVHSLVTRSANLGSDPMAYVATGQLRIQQIDPAELSPGEFIHRVRADVDERHARLIVIDSLNGLLNAMPGEDYLAIQMHELLTFLSHRGVVILLVLSQAGVLGATMHSPVDLSYLADNMLLFRYFEAAGKVRKALSIVKKRGSEHEDTIRELHLRTGCIVVGDPLVEFQGVMTGTPNYLGVASQLVLTDGDAS
jgi:circadian clock protein KaiC